MIDWIRTYTGKRFNVFEPTPEVIDIRDIAHALSNTCRFGGHLTEFFSVAEHCTNTASLLDKELAIYGLLHDAGEAYLTDIPTPIKHRLPNIIALERGILSCIAERFGLVEEKFYCRELKKVDWYLCVREAKKLLPQGVEGWEGCSEFGLENIGDFKMVFTNAFAPTVAEHLFLQLFQELTHEKV
ncbi:hypothetical protein LCGC14_0475930 [marine sediment metagenome]|uniref:HD domain-containing protein n=1 Tax=marine sediment metagenome TaxID=412755 RepID=A0A0F9UXR2_9ZZZZ